MRACGRRPWRALARGKGSPTFVRRSSVRIGSGRARLADASVQKAPHDDVSTNDQENHMPHFVLGRTAALAATLSCGLAAVAHACVHKPPKPQPPVCNTASKHSLGGTNDASDPPVPQPANRYKHHLRRLPGHGGGLTGAASHSPSLSICGPADGGSDGTTTPPSDNSGTPPTDGGSSTPPTD